jgi:hypothetical protein
VNSITLTIDEHGGIFRICADEEREVYSVQPSVPEERVYRNRAILVGPKHMDEQIECWLA